MITKVIATATIMRGAVCRKMLRRLVWVKNVSVISENVTAITTKKTAMLTTPPLSWMISLARSRIALGTAVALKNAPRFRAALQPKPTGIFYPR